MKDKGLIVHMQKNPHISLIQRWVGGSKVLSRLCQDLKALNVEASLNDVQVFLKEIRVYAGISNKQSCNVVTSKVS